MYCEWVGATIPYSTKRLLFIDLCKRQLTIIESSSCKGSHSDINYEPFARILFDSPGDFHKHSSELDQQSETVEHHEIFENKYLS